jgi:hypothetical protein
MCRSGLFAANKPQRGGSDTRLEMALCPRQGTSVAPEFPALSTTMEKLKDIAALVTQATRRAGDFLSHCAAEHRFVPTSTCCWEAQSFGRGSA